MRSGLGDEQKVCVLIEDLAAQRLFCEQIVADVDRVQRPATRVAVPDPALGGVDLAVLLFAAVLRGDEFLKAAG